MGKLDFLFKTINPLRLAIFRLVFGFFAILEVLYFYKTYLIEDYIIAPKHLFNYHFLPLSPLDEGGMKFLLFLGLLSAIGIFIGKFYRLSTGMFFLIYSYIFFLDKAYYNNHLYLLALLAFLLFFIPANQALSFGKKDKKPAYYWQLLILRIQFFIVYFFGGLAKINSDWLILEEPAKSLLQAAGQDLEVLIPLIVWGGMLFDLLIGFFLFYRKTRIIACIAVLIFNISNHLLFDDINIFPFFMMASLVLFLKPEEWPFMQKYNKGKIESPAKQNNKKGIVIGLSIYLLIQVILPLRHYFINSNPDWTSEGQRFAWRMKIQHRTLKRMEFQLFDLDKKVIYPVTINQHINDYQEMQMMYYPYMMLDFAHYLGQYAKNNGVRNPMVKATVEVSFNGRDPQLVFSPDLDLLSVNWNTFGENEWIYPLK